MTEAIAIELITTFGVVLVAVLQLIQNSATKKERKDNEEYRKTREEAEKMREERDAALYALVFANSTGTEVLLHAAHGDHMNGNVDSALLDIHEAKANLNNICNAQMARI